MHTSDGKSFDMTRKGTATLRRLQPRGRMLPVALAVACGLVTCALVISRSPAAAQGAQTFRQDQIQAGSKVYAQRCATCHGQKMENPDAELGAFDLRYFPRDDHDRFVSSVRDGKNTMPAWGSVISAVDIEALWAYLCAGEK
jgi:mono/diheme cytochrome c family protein